MWLLSYRSYFAWNELNCFLLHVYNSGFAGFSQNHHHWTPETTAPFWLSSDHHCQWYLYQHVSSFICCDTCIYRYIWDTCCMKWCTSWPVYLKGSSFLLWVVLSQFNMNDFFISVSPYLKTLSMVASTKLLHLLEVRFYYSYANMELSSIMPFKFTGMFNVWLICKTLSYMYFYDQIFRGSFIIHSVMVCKDGLTGYRYLFLGQTGIVPLFF